MLIKEISAYNYDPINHMDEEDQVFNIYKNPYLVKRITNPGYKVQLAVLKTDPHYLQYIDNILPEIQRLLIKIRPDHIEYIKHPLPSIQAAALRSSMNNLKSISDLSIDVLNRYKSKIIKFLLVKIKRDGIEAIHPELRTLNDTGIDWPELNIIHKSLSAEYSRLTR